MKFLITGDIHERPTSPENRVGDFNEDMKLKRMEVRKIAEKHGVSAIIQPGDFWDNPSPPLDFASEIIKDWLGIDTGEMLQRFSQITSELAMRNGELQKLLTKILLSGKEISQDVISKEIKEIEKISKAMEDDIEKSKVDVSVPLVSVVGNHELFGNNIATLPRTFTGFMSKLGLIRLASKSEPVIFKTPEGITVAITGTHYHLDIDKPENISDYIVEEKLGDIHIHVVHGMLSNKSMGKLIRHTIIDQIAHTKADLTIAGHDHLGFPLTEIDGKYFVNVGAIPRLSNNLKEIDRKPKVMIAEITKDKKLKFEEIYLQTAKRGDLVLSRAKIEAKKAQEGKIEEYKKAVAEAGVKRFTDINELVVSIGENKKLPKELVNNVVNKVSKKIEEDNTRKLISNERPYVKKIVLENFQSHEYTELELDKGFNVLVGESSQGKSSIIRAFRLIYENKPRGKRYIRTGATECKVSVNLSNGTIISRYVEKKDGGKNGYIITEPDGTETYNNTTILPEVQRRLGYTSLYVDKDLDINLNFMLQGRGWFLIGDHISSPQKSKIIGSIYGTQHVDSIKKELVANRKKYKEQEKEVIKDIDKIDKEIEKFDFLKTMGDDIEKASKLFLEIKELEKKKQEVTELLQKRKMINQSMIDNQNLLSELKDMSVYFEDLSQIREMNERTIKIDTLLENRVDISRKMKTLMKSLVVTNDISIWRNNFSEVMNQIRIFEKALEYYPKKDELKKEIKIQEVIISNTEGVAGAIKLLEQCKKDNDKALKIQEGLQIAIELQNKKEIATKGLKGSDNALRKIDGLDSQSKAFQEIQDLFNKSREVSKLIALRNQKIEEIKQEQEQIDKATISIEKGIAKYQELLIEVGKCPTCYGTIDKVTIKRIVDEYSNNEEEDEENERSA